MGFMIYLILPGDPGKRSPSHKLSAECGRGAAKELLLGLGRALPHLRQLEQAGAGPRWEKPVPKSFTQALPSSSYQLLSSCFGPG